MPSWPQPSRMPPVRTRCSPVDKAQAIMAEQQDGHRVMMVGDGLNDAGALAQSDVGITVTETTAALTPASDAIMDAKRHCTTAARSCCFTPSRTTYRIGQPGASPCATMWWVCRSRFPVNLTPLFAAILMPLSSVTVVGFVPLPWRSQRVPKYRTDGCQSTTLMPLMPSCHRSASTFAPVSHRTDVRHLPLDHRKHSGGRCLLGGFHLGGTQRPV